MKARALVSGALGLFVTVGACGGSASSEHPDAGAGVDAARIDAHSFTTGVTSTGTTASGFTGTSPVGTGSTGSQPGSTGGSSTSGGSSSSTGSATTRTSGSTMASSAPFDAGRDAPFDSGQMLTNDAGFNDAMVQVDASSCVEDGGGGGTPLPHTCIIYPAGADDENECDGHHDPPSPFPANGTTGNGFDDNCNGLVDEGCSCPSVGATKPCFLVPASQTVNDLPVGWCATNSAGTVACEQSGRGAAWSGTCRGAQPPYETDVCAPGDFNCDGVALNAPGGCACKTAAIVCPTAPLTTVPYPQPGDLPLQVSAGDWFSDGAQVAMATSWQWSMTGGDCDNILPNPTFGLYSSPDGTGDPIGTTSTTLGMTMAEHGTVATGSALGSMPSVVFPAFALSGDYVLTASWELAGQPYTCTVQIQVRAPGLRAEACWSTEGQGDDLDLHVAKVNGFGSTCPHKQGWSDIDCASANQDCFYGDCYSASNDVVDWGYPTSPASSCNGWGAQTTGTTPCGNPRLDRDANGLSGVCDSTIVNPNTSSGVGGFSGGYGGGFCGPENINIDNPGDGDEFAVSVRFYARRSALNARTHADIYCNGARILAAGYDPLPNPSGEITSFYPQLATAGEDGNPASGEGGDMWKVGLVKTSIDGAGVLKCTVTPTQSTTADLTRDGTAAYCVDNASLDTGSSQVLLTSGGGVPANADALCFH